MNPFKANTLKNYSLLFEHHIKYILQSGLILDEDMDIILLYYNAKDVKVDEQGLTLFQKILGACSLASTILILQKRYSVLLSVVSASPLITITFNRLRETFRHKQRMKNLEIALTAVKNISKLNQMILEYYRVRRINNPNTSSVLNPYTKGMRELIETISDQEVNVFYKYRIFIKQIGSYVPSISDNYAHLDNIDITALFATDINTVNEAFLYLERICDVYVLLASNCLTALAFVLCPKVWANNNLEMDVIIDKIVPKIKSAALNCYNTINKKFDDIKYYYLNRSQVKNHIRKPKPSAANKLKISAYNTIAQTTEILEKSKIIYDKIQEVNLQHLDEKEKLTKCLYDLRCQVFDYYESLDILYKIFQVNINATQGKSAISHLEIPRLTNSDSDVPIEDASINPVEPSGDEEYELYIGANDSIPSESTDYGIFEEESRKFAALLSRELQQKVKEHSQFVAARKKRGIEDETSCKPVEVSDDDLPPVVVLPGTNFDTIEGRSNLSPPPPPPLPPIDLGLCGGNLNSPSTVNDFLEAIQTANKFLNNEVEVFGNSSDEES